METEEFQSLINEKPAVMLYFYNDNCAPCKVLRPKVQEMIQSDFAKLEFHLVNAEQFLSLAAQLGVFAAPTILCFFEGKEYIRESKNITMSELHSKIERLYNMIF